MAKVRSERDLVDHGIRALVDALGYGGAARFLRHFSKGNSDYLQIQKTIQGDASGPDLQKGQRALFQQAKLTDSRPNQPSRHADGSSPITTSRLRKNLADIDTNVAPVRRTTAPDVSRKFSFSVSKTPRSMV